jgi:hypothetical protein
MIPWWVWRVAPYAIGVAVVVIAAIGALHNAKEEGRNELRPEIERLEAVLAAERTGRARAEAAASSYRSEMDAIRSRPPVRTPVRLCVNPAPVPSPRDSAPGTNGSSSTTGSNTGPSGPNTQAGPDIGPDLYALAQSCDAEIAKLRALQGWVRDVR